MKADLFAECEWIRWFFP